MFLTITTTHQPATDLGYLLYKNPSRMQTFALSFGEAHVFYPEATPERCTVALLIDVDPVRLTRGTDGTDGFALQPYVNDRPYAVSSYLSVALSSVFGTALNGRSRERPALAAQPIPLVATVGVVAASNALIERIFTPLGYEITCERVTLDPAFPDWGDSRYTVLTLRHTLRLSELLAHLYVLAPVLDDDKHYWVDEDEVDKLLRLGGAWLAAHPAREEIVDRYLKRRRALTRKALVALENIFPDETAPDGENEAAREEVLEQRIGLHTLRLQAVTAMLVQHGARRVLDLGCGEGKLIHQLLQERQFEAICGIDVAARVLRIAQERLARLPERMQQRVTLLQSSLIYRDSRLAGYDAAAVVEVIEHLDPWRLRSFERILFEVIHPNTIVLTTPNREYNQMWQSLAAGGFRHRDHRFEWTRVEFAAWCQRMGESYGYRYSLHAIGPVDEQLGAPSQMVVFTQEGGNAN